MINAKIHTVKGDDQVVYIATISQKQDDGTFKLLDSHVFTDKKEAENYLTKKDLTKF